MTAIIAPGYSLQTGQSLAAAHVAHHMRADGLARLDVPDLLGGQVVIMLNERERRAVCGRAGSWVWS